MHMFNTYTEAGSRFYGVRMGQARTDISARTRDSGSDPIATYVSVCRRYKYTDKGMLFAFCFHCHRL